MSAEPQTLAEVGPSAANRGAARRPKRSREVPGADHRAESIAQRLHHRARRRGAGTGQSSATGRSPRGGIAARSTASRFRSRTSSIFATRRRRPPRACAMATSRRRDATVVGRLRQAGAVFIGKTNLHEFALGTTNEDSAYGPVAASVRRTRSPGGSSGGSAASCSPAWPTRRSAPTPADRFAFRRLPAGWSD